MTKNDALRISDYLEHLLEALKRISNYIDDINEISFLQNPLIQDAVIRNLEILGKATRNIERYHPEFAAQYSHIP